MVGFYFENYLVLFLAMILVFCFGVALILLSLTAGYYENDSETSSSYECGFAPFVETRISFDVKFYIISILFIIFDLEVILMFPWAIVVTWQGIFSFYVMMLFIVILLIGFIYEWQVGALDWIGLKY